MKTIKLIFSTLLVLVFSSIYSCTKHNYEQEHLFIQPKISPYPIDLPIIVNDSLYNLHYGDTSKCYYLSTPDSVMLVCGKCPYDNFNTYWSDENLNCKFDCPNIKVSVGYGGVISNFKIKLVTNGKLDENHNMNFVIICYDVAGRDPRKKENWEAKLGMKIFTGEISFLNCDKIKSITLIDNKYGKNLFLKK